MEPGKPRLPMSCEKGLYGAARENRNQWGRMRVARKGEESWKSKAAALIPSKTIASPEFDVEWKSVSSKLLRLHLLLFTDSHQRGGVTSPVTFPRRRLSRAVAGV